MNKNTYSIQAIPHTATDDSSSLLSAELITARDFARMLAISERTLYRLKSTGELPTPVILGGSVRWRLHEIRDWILKGCPKKQNTK